MQDTRCKTAAANHTSRQSESNWGPTASEGMTYSHAVPPATTQATCFDLLPEALGNACAARRRRGEARHTVCRKFRSRTHI
eukprot:7692447-Alexandrium_andersonii.AAC.1